MVQIHVGYLLMADMISVIVPVYNSARFVREAVISVLAQTYQEFELIVIDDGSIDGSGEILKELARNDDRIKFLKRHCPSGGPAIPRNMGLEMAKGRFVAFLDSDDIWDPKKLEVQVKFMLEKKAAISYTGYQRIGENGEGLRRVSVPEVMSYNALLKNTAIATSSVMLDRDIVGEVRFFRQGHEDYALWLRIVRKNSRCFGLNEELLKYRVVEGSVSSGKIKSAIWVWRIYRKSEGLSVSCSIWCLINYGARAIAKRMN